METIRPTKKVKYVRSVSEVVGYQMLDSSRLCPLWLLAPIDKYTPAINLDGCCSTLKYNPHFMILKLQLLLHTIFDKMRMLSRARGALFAFHTGAGI
ncbi:uncharacterized protein G2W53_032951 [Senna tora]|uniref:Uncharacterized protein n=1 Tax=Senna tora TaxID=362788 RepID=A0A834SXE2_9FABA|nr:uncharacterized protein G2W53_032951 [Senna tora]